MPCKHIAAGNAKDNGTGLCWACGANRSAEQQLTGGDAGHWNKVWTHFREIRSGQQGNRNDDD